MIQIAEKIGLPVTAVRIRYLRHAAGGDAEQGQQFFIPLQGMDIEQLGPGGIGIIRAEFFSLRQPEHHIAVHGTAADFAFLCPFPDPRHVLQYPGQLCGGKIGG